MVARVPFIQRLEPHREAPHPRVWTIVLTGDEPPAAACAPPRRRECRPVRRWPATRSTAPRTPELLERASRLAPAGQMLTVLTRQQAAAWDPALSAVPHARRVVQPVYRGRAAEVLLPLLKIARHDPSATVVILPADHQRFDHDPRFTRYVGRAVWAVALRPDLPILIGAHPNAAVADGWIEPGAPVEGLEDLSVRSVTRFVDHASPAERRRLFESHALTSTSILVGRAGTLMALAARTLPEVLEALEPLEDVLDRAEESLLCDAVYECMPENDLAPLERAPELVVLALPDVVWRVPEREIEAVYLLAS
jgi:mannose-1-phosphate guanylyltransferase